jgi:hypothetical protein
MTLPAPIPLFLILVALSTVGFPLKSIFTFDEIEILTKFYPHFVDISIFRNFNFGFNVDYLFSMISKFRQNPILISSKFRCQKQNFDFGFDGKFGISISVRFQHRNFDTVFGIGISILWFRNRNFDSDFIIGISIPTSEFRFRYQTWPISMSKFQSIFLWNKSKFLFWYLVGILTNNFVESQH